MRGIVRGIVLLSILPACSGVASSVYRTGAPAPAGPAAPAELVPAPAAPRVPVSVTRDPPGAVEVAVIEVHGQIVPHAVVEANKGRPLGSATKGGGGTLAALVAEFQRRVAEAGGDHARIDRFATKYERISESYTYDCGKSETKHETRTVWRTDAQGRSQPQTETVPVTKHEPKTCTGTRQVEAATLSLTGRALRTAAGGKP